MIAPHTTWLMVSGFLKSSCGIPSAMAAQGTSSRPAISGANRIFGIVFMGALSGRAGAPTRSDEQDDEGDDESIERHRFGQREAQNRQAEHPVTGCRVAGDAGYQRGKDMADTDAHAGERDDGNACTNVLGGN